MVVGEEGDFNVTDADFDNVSHVEWNSGPFACPAGAMEVLTYGANGESPTHGEIDEGGFDLTALDQPFTFVIP